MRFPIHGFLLVGCVLRHVKATPESKQPPKMRRAGSNQGRSFVYLSSEDIHHRVQELATLYPQFTTLVTSQDAFGLPAAGTSKDCPFDTSGDGCRNWVLTIEDLVSHEANGNPQDPDTLPSSKELPEVLLSGCLHGNERVGPTTVVETATLLLDAVACEASLHPASVLYQPEDNHCIVKLQQNWGIQDDSTRQWLARLVATRRIVIVPTANALGYYRNKREEDGIDPNRDFPYDLDDYSQCMQTVAARTLNEVFREHMFQLSFTFHAGMEAIGYEWGAPHYEHQTSPDDVAQSALAARYSWYGGAFPDRDGNLYPYGDMNGLVYPVQGGMEDWAYAASWDPERTQPCHPNSKVGPYDASKTIYDDSTLRVFNMLVETSNKKTPADEDLGSATVDLFNPANTQDGNGHINRNIRLSLLLLDMVQPYVKLTHIKQEELPRDRIPATKLYQRASTCVGDEPGTGALVVELDPTEALSIKIEWTVGGAFDVDETFLVYGKLSDVQNLSIYEHGQGCDVQPHPTQWEDLAAALDDPNSSLQQTPPIKEGRTRWHEHGPSPIEMMGEGEMPLDPVFRAELSLADTSGPWIALAVAKVDSKWAAIPNGVTLPPQSHVVNARTNTSWYHEKLDIHKRIQGRTHWISMPMTLEFAFVEETIPDNRVGGGEPQNDEDKENVDESTPPHKSEPKRDRGKEEEDALVSPKNKTQSDPDVDEPPLSLLQTIVALVAIFTIGGLIVSRIWTNKVRAKRRYRKTGRKPHMEVETVALSDDSQLDIHEFESENPFADPHNEGRFVQYRDDPHAKIMSL